MSRRHILSFALIGLSVAACTSATPDNAMMPLNEGDGIMNDTVVIDPGLVGASDIPNEMESVESNSVAPFPADENVAATEAYIALQPVQFGDTSVITGNVGGCTFKDAEGKALLVVGNPDDRSAHAIGVAREDGKRIKLTGVDSGTGYVDGGPVMQAGPLTLTVRRAAGEGKSIGVETRGWSADLVATDTDGNKRVYGAGNWACGV